MKVCGTSYALNNITCIQYLPHQVDWSATFIQISMQYAAISADHGVCRGTGALEGPSVFDPSQKNIPQTALGGLARGFCCMAGNVGLSCGGQGSHVCSRMGTSCLMLPHHSWVKSDYCISAPSVVPPLYFRYGATAHSSVRAACGSFWALSPPPFYMQYWSSLAFRCRWNSQIFAGKYQYTLPSSAPQGKHAGEAPF